MSSIRGFMFNLEKGLEYINKKFWCAMIYINKIINQDWFQFLIYVVTAGVIVLYLYSLYRGLI